MTIPFIPDLPGEYTITVEGVGKRNYCKCDYNDNCNKLKLQNTLYLLQHFVIWAISQFIELLI